MSKSRFPGRCTQTILQAMAAIAATGNTAGLDINNLKGEALVVFSGVKTAGTNPTLAVALKVAPDVSAIDSIVAGANAGDGAIYDAWGGPDAVEEDIVVTLTSASSATVVGSVSGSLGNATVGTKFEHANVSFLLAAGDTAFEADDAFTIATLARVYAAVPGSSIASLTTDPSTQKHAIHIDKIGRYLRAYYTVGGTVGPSYMVSITLFTDNT